MKKYILGIDTSAYTTSIALVDYEGNVLYNLRKNLEVADGEKGLRQGTAVFKHLNNLPELFNELNINYNEIGIISVSAYPRTIANSYMPVFVVGKNFASVLTKAVDAEYIHYSHQENHISAAIMDSYKTYDYSKKDILAIHISGGTCEFLLSKKSQVGFKTEIVGGSKDITFGQLIDRIGVYLGFSFPCGKHLQDCVLESKIYEKNIKPVMPRVCGDKFINLSGVENYYKKLIDSNEYDKETIIYSLFCYVSKCMIKMISSVIENIDVEKIIISGGVSANMFIRKAVNNEFCSKYDVIFPKNELSTDNALGNAMLPIIDRWYYEDKAN